MTHPCNVCRTPKDFAGVKASRNCDLLDGQTCPPCKEFADLEAQISLAKKTLDDMVARQSKLCRTINDFHDPITRRFPLEITILIFQLSLHEKWTVSAADLSMDDKSEELDNIRVDKSIELGPLFLGAVCKAWRDIAWAYPALWAVIRIRHHPTNLNTAYLTRQWFERACQLPLSIHLSYQSRPGEDVTSRQLYALRLIAIVNEQSGRWRNLDITGPTWLIARIRGDFNGAPILRKLKIDPIDMYGSSTGPLYETAFSLVGPKPQPVRVSINVCRLSPLDIEWNHVTHVYAALLHLDDCIELLQRAHQLDHCKFYVICPSMDSFPIPDHPITHHALKSLELDHDHTNESQARETMVLFDSFTFPNLAHLKIIDRTYEGYENQDPISWYPIVAHIIRSSPPLISLSICDSAPKPITDFFLPILRKTPLLRTLEMSMLDHFSDGIFQEGLDFFRLLADTCIPNSAENTFLPNLQCIEFRMVDDLDFWSSVPMIFGPISEFLHPCKRPLNTLRVRCKMLGMQMDTVVIPSHVALQRLRDLEREGIVLDLKDEYLEFDILELSINHYHNLKQGSGKCSSKCGTRTESTDST